MKLIPLRDISFTHDNYFSLVYSINPGLSKKGLISFEVPEGVNSYILGIETICLTLAVQNIDMLSLSKNNVLKYYTPGKKHSHMRVLFTSHK